MKTEDQNTRRKGEIMMRKTIGFFLAFCLLICSISIGASESLKLSYSMTSMEKGKISPKYSFQSDYEAIEKAIHSIFYVEIFDARDKYIGSASGFVAFQEHLFITNYHVIKDAAYLVIWDEDKNSYILDQVAVLDIANDLAIVSFLDGEKYEPLDYELNASLKRGQPVTTIGSPQGMQNTVAFGNISAFPKFDEQEMIQFTAPISHGSSGGVLFNDSGKIIGITTAILSEGENIGFAVPIDELFHLYSSWNKTSYKAMNAFTIRNYIFFGDTITDVISKETLPLLELQDIEWMDYGKGTIWGIDNCEIHYHFNRQRQLDKTLIIFTSQSEDSLSRLDKAQKAEAYLHNHFGKSLVASNEKIVSSWVGTKYAQEAIDDCLKRGGKAGINGKKLWSIADGGHTIYIDCVSYYMQAKGSSKITYHYVIGFNYE